jgi:hypothetical protein
MKRELTLPWPEGLPIGAPVGLDEERDATPAEHRAAEQIVGGACWKDHLGPVRSLVAALQRPAGLPRAHEVEQHLVITIVGHRWALAAGGEPSTTCRCAAPAIERLYASLRRSAG